METEKKTDDEPTTLYDVYKIVRSASIGLLLIVFAATKLPFLAQKTAEFNTKHLECEDIDEALQELCDWGLCIDVCSSISQTLSAFAIMAAGLGVTIIFSIAGIAIYANPQAECGTKRSGTAFIAMLGLIFGGLGYMIGYWDMMDIALQSEAKGRATFNWWLTIWFFEFYLGGITAILFGVNCYFRFWDNKIQRIFGVLVQLLIVSVVLFICYTYIAVQRSQHVDDIWSLALIATGYGVILLSGSSFVVFWFIVRNQKDSTKCHEITKNAICVLMIIGSLLAAIGFWGEFNEYNPHNNALNSWNTAYCLLLMGLCVFNATDLRNCEPFKYDTVPKQEN